jgi:hypothetical protein
MIALETSSAAVWRNALAGTQKSFHKTDLNQKLVE